MSKKKIPHSNPQKDIHSGFNPNLDGCQKRSGEDVFPPEGLLVVSILI